MRREMRNTLTEEQKKNDMAQRMSERRQHGDQLFEKWSSKKGIGEGMDKIYESNPDKARGLSMILENQTQYMKNLTETQLSTAFSTTPENVLKVIRLGYPNSVRGEIFLEWAMETARDSMYYLSPIYASTARGATSGNITHESGAYRYASEMEVDTCTTGDNTNYVGSSAGAVPNPPLRAFTVLIFANNAPVGKDDGLGNIVNVYGGTAITEGANSTINYTTGALAVRFASADAGRTVTAQYNFDSEQSAQYADIGSVELVLRDIQFKCNPWPLGVGWSKMTELLLGTTLNIDAEEALMRGAGEELKKALDFHALRYGYQVSQGNTAITFDADFASAGADSEMAHAQSVTRAFDDAGDLIFNALQRGGVTACYGGSSAINFVKLHNRFSSAGMQPKIGAHKVGSLDGMNMYKVPSSIVPANEIVCVWKNESVPEDVSIAFGSLIPLYQTQTIEYKNFYKETGLASFGDQRVLQSKYIVRIQFTNL